MWLFLWGFFFLTPPALSQNLQVSDCNVAVRSALGPPAHFTSDPRWSELAYDPAHRGVTHNSEVEAMVGLSMERSGQLLGPIRRDATGAAEFIDAQGVRWDVKGFRSFDPNGVRMSMGDAILKIDQELAGGENLILDSRGLTHEDIALLRAHIAGKAMNKRVIWFD